VAAPVSARVIFRPMAPADWPAVAETYRQGIEFGDATFETEVSTWETWNAPLARCRADGATQPGRANVVTTQ
jgi:L-amino acid N-acyltransferase YncA